MNNDNRVKVNIEEEPAYGSAQNYTGSEDARDAGDSLKDRAHALKDKSQPYVEDIREKSQPYVEDFVEKSKPYLEQAKKFGITAGLAVTHYGARGLRAANKKLQEFEK